MSTDYRAELQRLVQAYDDHGGRWPDEDVQALHNAVEAARTTLAQSEPEGPSYRDALALRDELDADGHGTVDLVAFAHAVLARSARPAILAPVPVSERLPGPGDCDAEGRCWLTSVDVEPGWVTDNPEQCTNWTHWLPHWALPVPAPANNTRGTH
jgi:hypothetical protein